MPKLELVKASSTSLSAVFVMVTKAGESILQVLMSEAPFRPREKLFEKQKYFQHIPKHTYLKGPMDKVTSVAIPLALAASSIYLIILVYALPLPLHALDKLNGFPYRSLSISIFSLWLELLGEWLSLSYRWWQEPVKWSKVDPSADWNSIAFLTLRNSDTFKILSLYDVVGCAYSLPKSEAQNTKGKFSRSKHAKEAICFTVIKAYFVKCVNVSTDLPLTSRYCSLSRSSYRAQIFNAAHQNSDTKKFMDGQNPQTRAQQLTTKLETNFLVGGLWGI
ncbi:hypothetical protein V8G54_023015 [Vigna mungo]|uniref:Uncharacterized protein n=1 Tax=Vigna mungo TaxID=3915 RepID=A0AAQ3RRS9_VIGMU